jgi:hypothetical protein
MVAIVFASLQFAVRLINDVFISAFLIYVKSKIGFKPVGWGRFRPALAPNTEENRFIFQRGLL